MNRRRCGTNTRSAAGEFDIVSSNCAVQYTISRNMVSQFTVGKWSRENISFLYVLPYGQLKVKKKQFWRDASTASRSAWVLFWDSWGQNHNLARSLIQSWQNNTKIDTLKLNYFKVEDGSISLNWAMLVTKTFWFGTGFRLFSPFWNFSVWMWPFFMRYLRNIAVFAKRYRLC